MSSNMQHQAVPLSRSKKCIVGTGLERQVPLDYGALAISKYEGKGYLYNTDKVPWGKCINKVQILADGAATVGGELTLGKNLLVAYIPWEGYNSADAVLIRENLVYEDIYTSFHIQKYEIQTHVTSQGPEKVTIEIPHLEAHLLHNLDKNGIVMLGS
ncbi:DNA-directed RNA polymerase subunit beta [Capsicum chinense]|nr:DNA-directed RNA polymerase subunit beta [Capsicum chinense]